ncbi:MAG TPA: peptidylprolyl isomerase [Burkholderiales bacterium]|nr:peptidylprolyl isomerase [Burkholderiales bacterium]
MFSRPVRLAAALSLCISAAAWAQSPASPTTSKAATPAKEGSQAVTVNGKPIPKSRVDFIVKQRAAQGQPDSEQSRRMILDNLITQEVVAQEADRKGFGKGPEFRAQLDLMRQQALVQALIQDYMKAHPIKEEDMQAEYNKIKASRNDKEYKARHILVDKDTEANDIIAQLKKGAKFEDLAKQSKDPGSKDKGGDLDWNPPGTFVKPFADALTKLEKGKYTETPVQTQFGWHVIQLDDVRAQTFPPYDSVKQQLHSRLQDQEIQKYVGELRAKATIK